MYTLEFSGLGLINGRKVENILMVSMGALDNGPMAPDIKPMTMVWYEGSSVS